MIYSNGIFYRWSVLYVLPMKIWVPIFPAYESDPKFPQVFISRKRKNWIWFSPRIIFIYLCIHKKWSSWDCVIKLHDNRIFKALLPAKKSFKSINLGLAKHVLVFNVNHCWNLFEKIQILKLKWTYWEATLAATA